MRKRLKNSEKSVYRCSRYNNNGSKACSSHYIDEEFIRAFVLDDIRTYAQLAANKRDELADKLCKAFKNTSGSELSMIRSKIKSIEKRLQEVNDRMKNIYEDKFLGKIPEDIAFGLMKDFTSEKPNLKPNCRN